MIASCGRRALLRRRQTWKNAMTTVGPSAAPFNENEWQRHVRRNTMRSIALLAAMVALLWGCTWLSFGAWTATMLAGASTAILVLGPMAAPRLILGFSRARRLRPFELPALSSLVHELADRAGLDTVPSLLYVPDPAPNAFVIGRRRAPMIAVTGGLLRILDRRELAGVLAHEISHIRHNDLWIMGVAALLGRLTLLLAAIGVVTLLVGLLFAAAGHDTAAVGWIGALLAAPAAVFLVYTALSRTREFEADLGSAALTRDPLGLVSALVTLERHRVNGWLTWFLRGGTATVAPTTGPHPGSRERIRRLLSLGDAGRSERPTYGIAVVVPADSLVDHLGLRRWFAPMA
jgi:heat shock protein HtpX